MVRKLFREREATRPKGVLERFKSFGFDKLFKTYNEMAEETQWHQFASLKYEIESIRSHDSIQGYVITGITDVHWEVNGLLDMWRNEKVYAKEVSSIQQSDLILCRVPKYCFTPGDKAELSVVLSHFSAIDLSGARVRWSTDWGQGGQFVLPDGIQRGSVAVLQSIPLEMPAVDRPTIERIEIELRLRNGHRVAENSYDLFVLPEDSGRKPDVMQKGRLGSLHAGLSESGYAVNTNLSPEMVLIADQYDAVVAEHLQNGGNVLLICGSEDAVPSTWPLKIKARVGELEGRWFSNFNWIRTDREPFSAVAFTPILGFESAAVAPEYVIECDWQNTPDDVLSGITYGWLNRNCALAMQMRTSGGKVMLTTFRFEKYGSDRYAMRLFDSLIRYMSPACQPKWEVPILVPAAAD